MDFKEYNITIRLGSLLSLPSKFIQSLRRMDDMLNMDLEAHHTTPGLAMSMTSAAYEGGTHMARPPPSPHSFSYELIATPGAFSFLTSGYALGLVAMTLILNRIQHIVVPPRRLMSYRLVRDRRTFLRALLYTFFPIDLSQTVYRLVLRLPSLYLLYKAVALFSIIIMQAYGVFPSERIPALQTYAQWASQSEMADVCWIVYKAICLALVIGALTRGLEGANTNNSTPFNLFGYAMMLHIYATPMSHGNKGATTHLSRPDRDALITLYLPLLQLTMIHSLGVNRKWARYRLVPTGLCSLLTLAHFSYILLTNPASYPLLNYLPCLLETILLVITLLTVALNVLTQLLLEGQVTRPLFGHARTLAPKWDEDFAIVLLRLGTASLEATSVAGLGKELGRVPVGDSRTFTRSAEASGGTVELTGDGVMSIVPSKANRGKRGFSNEIKNVKVKTDDGSLLIDQQWLRGLQHYGSALLGIIRGFSYLLLWLVWYRWRGVSIFNSEAEGQTVDTFEPARPASGLSDKEDVIEDEDTIYSRFLNGETASDDEDDADYVPFDIAAGTHSDRSSEADDMDDPEVEESDSDGKEAANLYSDILIPSSTVPSASPGPVLFAHMTTSSDAPLTRRRYKQLISNQQTHDTQGDDIGWLALAQERRSLKRTLPAPDLSLEGRMACVICTSEPREVICWPCRCLALCDDCRENLASRQSASKHSCPCCRRNVEGYSRIYIP